jgi:type I restriction enzyme R subunit
MKLTESARVEAFQHVLHLGSHDVMTNNEKFHQMLTDGVTVEYFKQGETIGLQVQLMDFDHPENNDFLCVNQFVIKENNQSKRFDVVLFVNGLPLVVVELKSAVSEKATLERAYTQIQNYKTAVPSIFFYNALCVISDGVDARTSSLSAPFSRYLAWKSPVKEENGILPELQILAERMLNKAVLLKLIRFNTVFESEEVKDDKTGLLSLVKVKKIAAYHQYYLVEKAVQSTLRAICRNKSSNFALSVQEDPASYGLPSVTDQPEGDKKIGVVWHTQGSGKSLSMVFYAGQLVVEPAMGNPTLVVLTDRNDLDDQLFATFGNCASLLRQKPVQATSRENLKELLQVSGGGIVFTTIQKFYPEDGVSRFETLSERSNIGVLSASVHEKQIQMR